MIQPTPGRIVWYYPSGPDLRGGNERPMAVNGPDPLAAQIVGVISDRFVNLLVSDAYGYQFRRLRTQLLQGDGQDTPTDTDAPHCAWMPYQQGKAERKDSSLAPVQEKSVADRLRDLIAIQTTPGTIDQGDYMLGMANGLICALSVVTGEDPQYVEIKDFKLRVQIEQRELDAKVRKLGAFIGSTNFERLPEAEQNRLMKQRGLMHDYSKILNERIAAFN